MTTAIKGGKIYKSGAFLPNELFVVDAREKAGLESETGSDFDFERVINADNSFILPSFCDVHVHLGIVQTVVYPPCAAALLPALMVSL